MYFKNCIVYPQIVQLGSNFVSKEKIACNNADDSCFVTRELPNLTLNFVFCFIIILKCMKAVSEIMEYQENGENTACEKNTYLFLDFNGKIPLEVFSSKVFIQIANLREKNPLVQINDSVFKGTYDYSIGTNLFFEEIEEDRPVDVFEQQAPIHLKHDVTDMKVLNLKPVKICATKDTLPKEVTKIEYNFKWEYKELLDRFEKGTLNIKDIVLNEYQDKSTNQELADNKQEQPEEKDEEEDNTNMDFGMEIREDFVEKTTDKENPIKENPIETVANMKRLESDYEKLKMAAGRPVKRAVSPELVMECETKYRERFEYHNIESQILKPSAAFRTEIVTDIDESSLCNCIDIDRCILYGIIRPSAQHPRILTEEEKAKLLTFDNFENLSLAARYYVLKNHVHNLENFLNTLPKETPQETDEFGRTPQQTLEIYKKLCKAVMNRIQEIKLSQQSNDMTEETKDTQEITEN